MQYGGFDVVWYDLSLVFSKPEKYFVLEFGKDDVMESVVTEDDVRGVSRICAYLNVIPNAEPAPSIFRNNQRPSNAIQPNSNA